MNNQPALPFHNDSPAFSSAIVVGKKLSTSEKAVAEGTARRITRETAAHTDITGLTFEAILHMSLRWGSDQLVVLHEHDFAVMDAVNDAREATGGERLSILIIPTVQLPTTTSSKPFRHVSVGGTFNTFHQGHQAYLTMALALADVVHVFIASDGYAKARKDYRPKSAENRTTHLHDFFGTVEATGRIQAEQLDNVEAIERYACREVDLDLVLTERQYVDWFNDWNKLRKESGLVPFHILCKARTRVGGREFASSDFTRVRTKRAKPEVGAHLF